MTERQITVRFRTSHVRVARSQECSQDSGRQRTEPHPDRATGSVLVLPPSAIRELVNSGSTMTRDDRSIEAAVMLRGPITRVDVAASAAVVAVSAVVALMIHRTLTYCSYGGGPPPPCSHPTDYPLAFRLGIVAAGLAIAGLVVVIRHRGRVTK